MFWTVDIYPVCGGFTSKDYRSATDAYFAWNEAKKLFNGGMATRVVLFRPDGSVYSERG